MTPTRIAATLAALALLGACSDAPDGDGTAVPAANSAAVARTAPTEGPLSVYVGKRPFEPVEGVAFLDHPRAHAAIEAAVRNDDPRAWVFRRDATRAPIVMSGGRLLSRGCETSGCTGRNWTILIDPIGAVAEVCYRASGAARPLWFISGRAPVPRDGDCPAE